MRTHNAHPGWSKEGQLAVDPTDFECTQAGEMMLSTLTDALRLAEGAGSDEPASPPSISDIGYAATPTGNRTFDDACALYTALRQAERAFPNTNNDPQREAALGDACDRTDAALRAMLAIPVTDHHRAALKIGAAFERYDIAKSGLLGDGEGAVLLQAVQVLLRSAPPTPQSGRTARSQDASSDPFDTILANAMRASAEARPDTHRALAACPVTTPEQFLRKVTFLAETGWYDSDEDTALLLENARQLAAAATPAPVADRTEWEHNLASHRALSATYEANAQIFGGMTGDEPSYAEIERQHVAAMRADIAAEKALFATPAPDLAAVLTKAELLFENHYHDDRMDALVADLRRLQARTVQAVQPVSDEWETALAIFTAAKTAERIYDETTYLPAFARWAADGTDIPDDIEQESDRLMNVRHEAEKVLMAIDAPDAAALAYKFLIPHADGRDANQWDAGLAEEALRFAPHFPREAALP